VPLQLINIVNLNKSLLSAAEIYQKVEHQKIGEKKFGGRGGI
jgi:hypothetical protein